MRQADTVLRELENLFRDKSDVDTASIVVEWADNLRNEYEANVRAKQALAREQESMRFYGLYETKVYTDGRVSGRNIVAHRRIKPEDFKAFCRARGLDENRLRAVALGDEYMYNDFVRASSSPYMLGHEYRAPREESEPKPRKGVSLFPKVGNNYPEDHDPRKEAKR